MQDPLFVEFIVTKLTAQIETAKARIVSGELTVDEVIAVANEIKAMESRIDRAKNPRTRKPKTVEPAPVAEAA